MITSWFTALAHGFCLLTQQHELPGVVEPDVALGTSSQSSYASVTAGKRKYVGGGDEGEPATRRRKREAGGSGRANAAEVIVIDD